MSTTRRQFLQNITVTGAAALAASRLQRVAAKQATAASPWRSRIGLEVYTVRDLLATDFEGTLAKVAEIGYTEIEPTGYNNMAPKDFRAMLDRHKLTMPSTHSAARGEGADLEKMLEGFQIMGIKYTEIQAGGARGGGAPAAAPPRGGAAPIAPRPATLPPGAYYDAGTGLVHNAFKETRAFGPYQPAVSLDSVKRRAAQLNANGKIAQKFGMKMLVHNHTGEFEKMTDSPRTSYDVLLEETDPSLVAMQLDLGWAYIAGVDPIALFKAHPGRFELWHVKDVVGLKTVNPSLSPNARVSSMALVPVGSGDIDWKPVFAQSQLARLKHFCIEQDNAAAWGDSMAAARVSYQSLAETLG
jgi:sugar phosphate isomerase/epimerase